MGEEEARRVRVSHKLGPGMPGEWAEKKKTAYRAVINVLPQYGSITRHDQRPPSPVLPGAVGTKPWSCMDGGSRTAMSPSRRVPCQQRA